MPTTDTSALIAAFDEYQAFDLSRRAARGEFDAGLAALLAELDVREDRDTVNIAPLVERVRSGEFGQA